MSLETIRTISPATNEPVVTRTGVSSEDLKHIPVAAQAAFRSFSQSTTLEQRQKIVERALDTLEKKKDELAREVTEQMGRPIAYTGVEIATAIKRSRYLTRISTSVLGEEGIVPGEEEKGFRRYIKRSPVGVALIIFPWNVSQIRRILVYLQTLTGQYIVPLPHSCQQLDSCHSRWKRCYPEAFPPDSNNRRTVCLCFYRGRSSRKRAPILPLRIVHIY